MSHQVSHRPRVLLEYARCPECGGAVEVIHGPRQGVSTPHGTASGAVVYVFVQRPFWACGRCEWCEVAN